MTIVDREFRWTLPGSETCLSRLRFLTRLVSSGVVSSGVERPGWIFLLSIVMGHSGLLAYGLWKRAQWVRAAAIAGALLAAMVIFVVTCIEGLSLPVMLVAIFGLPLLASSCLAWKGSTHLQAPPIRGVVD